MGIPGHFTCFTRNLYADKEAAIGSGSGTMNCLQIGKGVHQGCISSLCLFNLYADYIMQNAGLHDSQTGIKIAGVHINNLRYADETEVKVKVTQSCPTVCDPMDYTVHGILQARILEWVAFPFYRGIFPTQGSNPGLLYYRQILYQLNHQGSPRILE